MQTNQSNKLVLHDWPWLTWFSGAFVLGAGIYVTVTTRGAGLNRWLLPAIFLGVGLLVFLFWARVLTITVDKSHNLLTLGYWAPLYFSKIEIPISEIALLQVQSIRSRSNSRIYRPVLVKRDGTRVPLRSAYSSGEVSKRYLVDQISAFIGVSNHADQSKIPVEPSNSVLAGYQPAQIAVSAPVQDQVTNGVHWHLETHNLGTSPVTRWVSPDFTLPNAFVLLNQKVGGAGVGDWLGNSVGRFLSQQALGLYGLPQTLTPGIGAAQPMPQPDPRLAQYFDVLTNAPDAARQILNPWVIQPVISWAMQYPAQQLQSPDHTGPLLILFSPNGLYLTFFNIAPDPQLAALTQLGVDLVRAQGTGSSQNAW